MLSKKVTAIYCQKDLKMVYRKKKFKSILLKWYSKHIIGLMSVNNILEKEMYLLLCHIFVVDVSQSSLNHSKNRIFFMIYFAPVNINKTCVCFP